MDKSKLMHRKFRLIWLFPNIVDSDDNYGNVMNQLRKHVDTIEFYTDVDQCIDFLTDVDGENVIMIIPAAHRQSLVPLIHDVPELYSVYIIRNDAVHVEQGTNPFRKERFLSCSIEEICKSLQRDTKQCDHDLFPVSIISSDGSAKLKLNELPPTFMYSQILKEILLEIDPDENAKEDLINFWCQHYYTNEAQLKKIGEFESNYRPESAIRWYTRENFTYDMLNRALRTMNVQIIMKMAFFLRDLLRQIKQQSEEQLANRTRKCIFRGQGMFNDDFEKLRKSQGGLLSFNSFLSTSTDREVSMMFCSIPPQDPNMTAVLFKIDLDLTSMCTPATLLSGDTQFSDEEEILFSMHSIFRIIKVSRTDQDGPWEVELASTNDDDKDLKQLSDYVRNDIGKGSGWYRLGHLMIRIGYFNEAEEIYQTLLERTPQSDSTDRARLYNQLAIAKHYRGEYQEALVYYHKKLEIEKNSAFVYPPYLATTYNNIASIYLNLGQYTEALAFYHETLKIEENFLPSDSPDLATTYNNIGVAHRRSGNDGEALRFYEKAVTINRKSLPSNHPDLARDYNNRATAYYQSGRYQESLEYYLKALRMEERSLLPNHRNLGMTYCGIGQACKKLNNYPAALENYQKAIAVFNESLSQNDPIWATIYSNLGALYLSMQDYAKAMELFYKTLKIEQKTLPAEHPDIAQTFNSIASVHQEQGDYEKALEFNQKARAIGEKSLPPNHPDLALLYKNTAILHFSVGNYSEALSFSERALRIFRTSFAEDALQIQECKELMSLTQNARQQDRCETS